jgi:hypothetical protein
MERKNKILRYLECYWDEISLPAYIFFLIQTDEKNMRGISWLSFSNSLILSRYLENSLYQCKKHEAVKVT